MSHHLDRYVGGIEDWSGVEDMTRCVCKMMQDDCQSMIIILLFHQNLLHDDITYSGCMILGPV